VAKFGRFAYDARVSGTIGAARDGWVNQTSLKSRAFPRILLIKLSAFGDVIHTLPLLPKLRRRYPSSRIDWLITPEHADIVRCHPALSNVIPFRRGDYAKFGRRWSATTGLVRLFKSLRRARYDLVIDVHGQFRSALCALASGASVRIGFDRPRSDKPALASRGQHGWNGAREGSWLVYTHHIPIPTLSVHAVDRYLWLADILGLDNEPPDFSIHLPSEAAGRVDALLDRHYLAGRPLALVVPGTLWETKHWQTTGFAEVARDLSRKGFAVVIGGSRKDRRRCEAVAAGCPTACDLSGQTSLAEFVVLAQRCAVVITNDSGPMHLAVALKKPVVSIFGPTDPVRIGPYGQPGSVVRAGVPCSPCDLRKLRHCPHDHQCMKQVTPAQVIERLEQVLEDSVGGERPSLCGKEVA
jgi:heptosyltransferase I